MQPGNKAADSHEIRPLTGIRGFASAWVVLFHFSTSWMLLLPELHWARPLFSRGGLGVDFFFLLSGFILCYAYNAGASRLGLSAYLRFLWFRLARVFPNHGATLIVLVLLIVGARGLGVPLSGDYPLSGLPFQLTMTHAWPFVDGGQWNYPSWSISAEWFAYLFIFPVAWHVLTLNLKAGTSLVLGYAMLGMWLFLLPALANPSCHATLRVSCEFIAGALFFNAYLRAERVTRYCQRGASGFLVIVLGVACFSPVGARFAAPTIVLLFPALLLGLTSESSLLSQVLSSSTALWLGRVSYALYMSHAIAEKCLKVVLPSSHFVNLPLALRLLVVCANVLLIFLCAAALYYWVEIPARNHMRRLSIWWAKRTVKIGAQTQASA